MQSATLEEKIAKLPPAILEAINSVDFAEKLQQIGKGNGLMLDKVEELMEEVGLVMIGDTHPSQFGKKIQDRLGLDPAKTPQVVHDVDAAIFQPIRNELMHLHGESVGINNSAASTTPKANVSTPPATSRAEAQPLPKTNSAGVGSPADYDMSRDAILSQIENPAPAEVTVSPTTIREVETNDPHTYIMKREDMLKKILLTPQNTAGAKRSMTEEALLVAKKKASEVPAANPQVSQSTGGGIGGTGISSNKETAETVLPKPPALQMTPGTPIISGVTTRLPRSPLAGATTLSVSTARSVAPGTQAVPSITPNGAAALKFDPSLIKKPVSLNADGSVATSAAMVSTPSTSTPPAKPISAIDKINSIVQVPPTKTTVSAKTSPAGAGGDKSLDPYREII